MADFKFNMGEQVRRKLHIQNVFVRYQFTNPGGYRKYICEWAVGGKLVEDWFAEDALEAIPTLPLDSTGSVIHLGDLVQHSANNALGRVIEIADEWVKAEPVGHNGDALKWMARMWKVLERGPEKQITLGSRVRVKETERTIYVTGGALKDIRDGTGATRTWFGVDSPHYRESELELIE